MKYLYVYVDSASQGNTCRTFSFREESEITVKNIQHCSSIAYSYNWVTIKPIARIPVEDLQAEQKQEETNQKISNIDNMIRELDEQAAKLYYEKNKLKGGLDE